MMKRLFGTRSGPEPATPEVSSVLFPRGLRVDVVGESNYQEALARACGGRQAQCRLPSTVHP